MSNGSQEATVVHDHEKAYDGMCSICGGAMFLTIGKDEFGMCEKHRIVWVVGWNCYSWHRNTPLKQMRAQALALNGYRVIARRGTKKEWRFDGPSWAKAAEKWFEGFLKLALERNPKLTREQLEAMTIDEMLPDEMLPDPQPPAPEKSMDFNKAEDRRLAYRAIEEQLDKAGSPEEARILMAVLTASPISLGFPSVEDLEKEVADGEMPDVLLQEIKRVLKIGERALVMVGDQGAMVSRWARLKVPIEGLVDDTTRPIE
jgi:primosomal protein N'